MLVLCSIRGVISFHSFSWYFLILVFVIVWNRPSRPMLLVPWTCWDLQRELELGQCSSCHWFFQCLMWKTQLQILFWIAGFCWHRPLKFMVIRLSILKPRPTGAMLTQLVNLFIWHLKYICFVFHKLSFKFQVLLQFLFNFFFYQASGAVMMRVSV